MNKSIYVVGSAVFDLVFRTKKLPVPGETLLGGQFATFPGGKGANQAVAIGRLGGDVHFVGCVGDDQFGDELKASLRKAGVDTTGLARISGSRSGCASVMIDEAGNNQIIVAPGANSAVRPEQVQSALVGVDGNSILAQLEIPMESVVEASKPGRFFLNPAPAAALGDDLLSRTYAFTPNETEAATLVGFALEHPTDCQRAARAFLDKGVANVVITLGDKGCYWACANQERFVEAPSVQVVDTVGAGDAFSGALTYFHNEGRDWTNALVLANHVAALSVTRHGAQPSMPTLAELKAFAGVVY